MAGRVAERTTRLAASPRAGRERWIPPVALGAVGLALFFCYLRLSGSPATGSPASAAPGDIGHL